MNRIVWVDYYKAIAIFLIVLGHATLNETDLVDFLFTFHVPAFFFISGYLERTDCCQTKEYLKKVIVSLVIPYFLWNILFLFFHLPLTVHNLLLMLCGVTRWNAASWFLMILVIIKLNALLYKNKRYLLGALLTVLLFALHFWGQHLPYLMDITFMFLPFFFAGMYGKTLIQKLLSAFRSKPFLLLTATAFLLSILILFYLHSPIVHTHTIIDFCSQFYLFWISGFLGVFVLLLFSQLFLKASNKVVILISTGTLFIMCSHYEVIKPVTSFLSHNNGDLIVLLFVFIYFLIQCLCLPVILKWAPILAGKKSASRHSIQSGSRQ